jgi:hypothetical protein
MVRWSEAGLQPQRRPSSSCATTRGSRFTHIASPATAHTKPPPLSRTNDMRHLPPAVFDAARDHHVLTLIRTRPGPSIAGWSGSLVLPPRAVLEFPDADWNWTDLSNNHRVPITFILENAALPWSWEVVSSRCDATRDIVRAHPEAPWSLRALRARKIKLAAGPDDDDDKSATAAVGRARKPSRRNAPSTGSRRWRSSAPLTPPRYARTSMCR